MLKKRLIATIYVRDGIAVQSIGFNRYLPVGRPEISVAAFSSWGIDEIFLIDITASKRNTHIDIAMVENVARSSAVPLTVGGGIKTVDQMGAMLAAGADKVCLNSAVLDNLDCIHEGTSKYGRQCIVASIDYAHLKGKNYIFDYRNRRISSKEVYEFFYSGTDATVGEILIHSVDRDGKKCGYDIDFLSELSSMTSTPVVWSGGAGCPTHFVEAFSNSKVSGVAAGNIFHFSEHSACIIKSCVMRHIPLRMDTQIDYQNMAINSAGRLDKISEYRLDSLLFEKLEIEKI